MALFNGIPIADPSKKGLNFTTKENFRFTIQGVTSDTEIEGHFSSALKDDQLPHVSDGDQEKSISMKRDYESSKGFRIDETVTIPITAGLREEIEDDSPVEDERDLKAEVEQPLLETGKRISDLNGEGYYDPGIKRRTEFRPGVHELESIHKFSRPKTNSPTFMTDPKDFVDEKHYQIIYTTNNQWVNPNTGRISMYEDLQQSDRDDTQLSTI